MTNSQTNQQSKWLFASVLVATLLALPVSAKECVVLLHGLARTSASMDKMETTLSANGYHVVNHGYASREGTIADLAATELPLALKSCEGYRPINFVTHSLGGILVRQYLTEKTVENLGRVVMLGPPNQGSHVVDNLKGVPGFAFINGDAGQELGTDKQSVPKQLGPVDFELGIIAGTKSINLVLSTMLPNPDDGKVSVEHTKVDGMSDHIALPVSHPFLMKDDDVIAQVLAFLISGKFASSTH